MNTDKNDIKKNNRIGKYKNAYVAMIYETHRFVLISTDTAVNPTNIMGASKRLCELIIQSFDKKIKAHKESEIPVLHVHHEDEDGSMYPLSNGTQRVDENGNNIFTFPGQDDKGHRKAQTEYSLVRFGVNYIIGTNSSIPHKYCVSIPFINTIVVYLIVIFNKVLRFYLRQARLLSNLYTCLSSIYLMNNTRLEGYQPMLMQN